VGESPHVGEDTGRDMSEHTGTLRVTIREAAARLGVTEGAIRKRIQRGSLPKEQGEDGRVYVYLPVSHDASHEQSHADPTYSPDPRDELIAQLRGEVDAWREEARRKDHLLAAALERIPPQIEAPRDERESPTEAATDTESTEPLAGTPGPQERISRPWWRRLFGA
jgi:hypothetical protein